MRVGCGERGAEAMRFKARCALRAGLALSYFGGVAVLDCIVCHKPLLRLEIASGEEQAT